MHLTQNELIAEAERRGVLLQPRTLTSWRAKGLLPELSDRGAGRGKGKLYAWADPDVLNQALAVRVLFDQRARSEFVLLALWHSGFRINTIRARQLWLQRLVTVQTDIDKAAQVAGSRENYLAKLSSDVAKKSETPRGLTKSSFEGIISAVVNSIYCLGDDFDVQAEFVTVSEMFEGFSALAIEKDRNRLPSDILSEKQFGSFEKAFSRAFSLPNRMALIRQASDEDMQATSDFLYKCRLFSGRFKINNSVSIPVPALGEVLSIIYLVHRIIGLAPMLDDTLEMVSRFVKQPGSKVIVRELIDLCGNYNIDDFINRLALG